MFGFSKRTSTKPTSTRKATFKPGFEALEKREVMSTASPAIHAVADNFGSSAVFYINELNHALYEHDATHGTRRLAAPNAIVAFSAGLDTDGHADLFATRKNGSFWEYSDLRHGWHELLGAHSVKSFAAVQGDRCYVEFQNGTLHEFNGALPSHRWTTVPGSGKISALDAVTDSSGNDAVYVLNTNKTFGEFYHCVAANQLLGNSALRISASSRCRTS